MKKGFKLKREMISHLALRKEHLTKHKYVLVNSNGTFENKVFYSETITKKINDFEFGESETVFYIEADSDKAYPTLEKMLEVLGVDIELIKMDSHGHKN